MKKMKKIKILFALSFLLFSACEKVDYMERDDFEPVDGESLLTIKVASYDDRKTTKNYKGASNESSFMLESNKKFIFSYETNLQVDRVIWEFWDGEESHSHNPIYFYAGYDIKTISLTIFNNDGQSYKTESQLNLFPRYPGPPFYVSDIIESGDKFKLTLGIYKNAWNNVFGDYYLIGSVIDEAWQDYQMISPADTNYRISSDGNLYEVTNGVGHWLKTSLELSHGDHNFGIVRFDDENAVWGNFKNSLFVSEEEPTLISFHLKDNGEVLPIISLPGENGDQGPSSVLRFTINDDNSVIVYVNLNDLFNNGNPWWSYLDQNEEWHSPLSLESVEDFPNWGKLTINNIDDFPVRMIWGLYEDQKNHNMSQSIFWDNYYQYIYLHVLKN